MNTFLSYLTFRSPYLLRNIISWLLTGADKKYRDAYPEVHCAGQTIIRQWFAMEASEVKILGVYDTSPEETIKVLIDGKIILAITCNDNYNYRYAPGFVRYVETDSYKIERYFLTTSLTLPDGIDDFIYHGYKIIDRKIILSLFRQFENEIEIIKDYIDTLSSSEEDDFRLIPIGKWTKNDYVAMLLLLRRDVSDLTFPVQLDESCICEIRKPIADTDIMISLTLKYGCPDICFSVETINSEEILQIHLKALQNALRMELMIADVPQLFIKFPKPKPQKRVKLAAINSDWLYNLFFMSEIESFINIDTTVERFKLCNHIVDKLSKVRLPSLLDSTSDESMKYPSLDL